MAKPIVGAVSSALKIAKMEALDTDEREGGETSIAAVLYQEGANFDAKMLFVMWTFGIMAPRLAKLAIEAEQKKRRGSVESPAKKENTVQGTATVIRHVESAA